MTQTSETNASVPDDQAAHFTKHPGVRALIIPLWMIESIRFDLYTSPQELVVQLVEEDSVEGEEDETA
jgi:hypothetical protein